MSISPQLDAIVCAKRVHTLAMPPGRPTAIAIRAGRIVEVGAKKKLLQARSRQTTVIDMPDATITPGLVDCHTHFFYWALQRSLVVDLSAAQSLADVQHKLRSEKVRKHADDWVIGAGFDYNRWSDTPPTARDLDAAVENRAALVYARDGHSVWLNSLGLRRAGIDSKTADPPGGRFLRDSKGRPTGIAQEKAIERLPNPLRDLARQNDGRTRRLVDRAIESATRFAHRLGIVGVHSMDDGPSLAHLQRLRGECRLGLRFLHAVQLADLDHAIALGLRSGLGDEWLRIGGVKIFSDGALGSQTAYMFESYPDKPGFCGVPVVAGEQLEADVQRAVSHGWATWIHAIGDRAVHDAVRAISKAARVGTPTLPHRIEHVQCARLGDIRAMARAGIIASVQPCHLMGDITTADRHWPRARRRAYALRQMLDANVTLAGGSDVPIESIDVRRSLYAATTRTDEQGMPAGGWFPTQRIRTRDMLWAFTRGAAAAAGLPMPFGTIADGALADLTVWQDDPLGLPPDALLEARILGCVVGGVPHLP